MPKVLFAKELIQNSVLVNGAAVKWQSLPGNHGYIELESPKDDALIVGLNELATKGVGGVYRISEEQLEAKKKQAALIPLSQQRKPKEMLRPMPKGPLARKPQGAPVVAAAPADEAQPFTRAALAHAASINTPQPITTISTAPISDPNAPIGEPVPAPVAEAFRPATRKVGRPRKVQDSVPA